MPTRPRPNLRRLCAFVLALSIGTLVFAAGVVRMRFDLPADAVERSVKRLSEQSGVDILMPTNLGKGVRTNAVKGEFTPREALDAMLAGLGLVAAQDERTGALTVRKETPEETKNASGRPVAVDRAAVQAGEGTGTIYGVATDVTTQGLLAGIAVNIPSLGISTLTDRSGRYRLTNVPPGDHTLEASYLSHETISRTVSVAAGGEVVLDLKFGSDVVTLSAFKVEGFREGWSKALQQKKTSDNLLEVISADSVGNLPDRNIADAISRLPGVALIADSGEGQFVTIRGMNPNLNNITLNGATLASSGIRNLDGRDSVSGSVVPLDVIGSANISQIEVTKTLLPSMDASAIGGTINLRTASAFDRDGRILYGSVAVGQSELTQKTILEGDITWGDRFGPERSIGVALSANYSRRPFRTEAFQSVFRPAAFGDRRMIPLSLELLPEDAERERLGVTGNFEFRPSEDVEFYVTAVANRFDEDNVRQEAYTRTNDNLGTFLAPAVIVFNNVQAEHRVFKTVTEQVQTNATAGIRRSLGDWLFEGEVTYSDAGQSRPEMKSLQFRNNNINSVPGMTDDYTHFRPTVTLGTSNFAVPSTYNMRIYDERDVDVDEKITTAKFDVTWEPKRRSAYGFKIKAGAKYYSSDRSTVVNVRSYTGSLNLADFGAQAGAQDVMGYNNGFSIDYDRAITYLEAHRSALVLNEVSTRSQSAANTFEVGQDIFAGYAMATADINRLHLIGGLRYEGTTADIRALEYRTVGTGVGTLFPNNADFDYSNVMPNFQARYEITKNLILRGAITASIRRPEYEFAAPASTLQVNNFSGGGGVPITDPANYPNLGLLTIGNPDLKPYESTNYDLALEYYLKTGGILSVALFKKNLENPIYQTLDLQQYVKYNDIGFQELNITSFQNGTAGEVEGVEVSMQVPFSFLPAPFDGFGIDGNVSIVSSKVQVATRPGVDLPLFEQPDRVLNAAIYYQKGRFSARFAYAYQDSSLRQIGTEALRDFYRADHYQTDAQASFKLTPAFTVFANVQNITNQPQDTYQGVPGWMRFRRSFGTVWRAGTRFRF